MPLDTCINNVGEYFSSHYLDSTFARDVKELVSKWNEQGSQSVPKRVAALSQHYFKAKTQALDEEVPENRHACGDEINGWHAQLLNALGYQDLQPFEHSVEGGDTYVPAMHRVNRYNRPWLVICETYFLLPDSSLKEGHPSEDPLSQSPSPKHQTQNTAPQNTKHQPPNTLCPGDWTRCIGRLFTDEDGPRWVLFLAGSQILLLDRNTFAQGRYLAFDLDDAFGRKEKDTFNHIAAFLSAETLCPGGESDEILLEKLEEQSHKFAHGVTDSLQGAVREAIELLINDWATDRRENQKLPLQKMRPTELAKDANGNPISIGLPLNEDGTYEITAEHLRREALAFVYRLLFCFYAEARGGELEILPIDQDAYRLGYSLESLRDLEQVPLTAATENGTYFHEHLKRLFQLIHSGFTPQIQPGANPQKTLEFEQVRYCTFAVRPLTATLFSPDTTPLLNRAKLSNRCLQQVIRNLSLSKDDKSRTIGRVNYAELGINQLGAVYEGLLSYKGMFADQDLIHVKPADKEFGDKKTPTWFVPKDRLDEFKKDEVERLPDGKPRIYVKGTFILHLNGIDREQSASYYTPEVLTKCLVEEALRELLKDYTPADADRILELKICEPAMGSGAFLNEAARQLAERYLELKQKQLQAESAPTTDADPQTQNTNNQTQSPTSIEPSRYADELRRVQHYIATRNIYGVDLNATAVELGALSLWLGSIHRLLLHRSETGGRDIYQPGSTPWFGLRLRCGNSLIGARRAVWTTDQLKRGEHSWTAAKAKEYAQNNPSAVPSPPLGGEGQGEGASIAASSSNRKKTKHKTPNTKHNPQPTLLPADRPRKITPGIPRLLRPGEERREDEIYHFLVFDPDMVPTHSDQLMKSFWPEHCAAAKKWITQQVTPKWTKEQTSEALKICDLIDQRWDNYSKLRQEALDRTECTATVWPAPSHSPAAVKPGPTLAEQERVKAELESTSGSFQRIKLVMDAWCAFWFWPLEDVTKLPSRDAFLTSARLLFGAEAPKDKLTLMMMSDRLGFDIEGLLTAIGGGQVPDTDILSANVPWFGMARSLSSEQNFHHWELVFPEVLGPSSVWNGFDLIVGNPPWIKASWADAAVLCELDPTLGVREVRSAEFNTRRKKLVAAQVPEDLGKVQDAPLKFYAGSFRQSGGSSSVLNSLRHYSDLAGIQTNLYKNFIVRSWDLLSLRGIVGLLHPEGTFDDARGGDFRRLIYPRLRAYYHFVNELPLFSDVGHQASFSLNIYGNTNNTINFRHMSNLYHPSTVKGSLAHNCPSQLVPGIKTDANEWNLHPHCHRIVTVTERELRIFASLLEESATDLTKTRFPQVHAQEIVRVIQKITASPKRLSTLSGQYYSTVMFDETYAQQDGIVTRVDHPSFEPHKATDWVISGPHLFVGTPFAKTPRTVCASKGAYDDIDLTGIPAGYLPRAVYRPGDVHQDRKVFETHVPSWPGPSLPGLWPVSSDEHAAWELLLNEPLRLYSIDGRDYIYISECGSDTPAAIRWMTEQSVAGIPLTALTSEFRDAYAVQSPPPSLFLQHFGQPITSRYRYANRRRISIGTERTLISAIIPPGASHVNVVMSVSFFDPHVMTVFAGTTASIVIDFILRITGKGDLYESTLSTFPLIGPPHDSPILARSLRLNCLTNDYEDLWTSLARGVVENESWTTCDKRLHTELPTSVMHGYGDSHSTEAIQENVSVRAERLEITSWPGLDLDRWAPSTPLRTDFDRRQALIELDVLVAQSLGLTLAELVTIYRVQFSVMRQYELVYEFDARGRRLPTSEANRRDPGGVQFRTAREEVLKKYPEAFKVRPAADALSPHWPFPEETSIPLSELPKAQSAGLCTSYNPKDQPLHDQTYGPNRVPITLDVSWEIDNGLQTVTKTFYPPFIKVDREEDYRRAWSVFEQRYGKQ